MENPEKQIEDKERLLLIKQTIERIFSTLTERQITVLKMRMGLKPYEKKYTLQEIADEFSITREPIRTQQEIALRIITGGLTNALRDADYPTEDIGILGGKNGIDNLLELIEHTQAELNKS